MRPRYILTRAQTIFRESSVASESNKAVKDNSAEYFLQALTKLSKKHGFALAGSPVLFVMEGTDFSSAYKMDDKAVVSFE